MAIGYGVSDPFKGGIVTTDLIFYIHPGIRSSYPGSGTIVTDIVGGQTVNMTGSSMSVRSGSFFFNGIDDKMEVLSSLIDIGGNNTLSSTTQHYTLEAWIYPFSSQGTTTDADCIIGNDTAVGVGMQLGINVGAPRINYAARSTSNFYGKNLTAGYNGWSHVVFSHDHGGDTNTYVNGLAEATTLSTTSFGIAAGTYGNMEIGNAAGRVSGFFDGLMGPIRIYKRALSSAEATQNFEAARGRYGV